MTTGGPLREPIPVARSILWSPAAGPKRPGQIAFPVFLQQSALAAIHEHLAAPPRPGQGMLGFLLGDLCECPDTNVSYLVIDAAVRLNQAIYGDRTRDVVTRLWDRVQSQLEEQKAHLIGWYHSHPPLSLSLTDHDVETHEQYFSEPWQVALLMGTNPAEPAGAFFRASGDDAWVSTALPFYELLDPQSIRPDGKKRSVVTWKNYRAYSAVSQQSGPHAAVSQDPTVPRMPAARPPAEPKFTAAPPAPPAPPPPKPKSAPQPPPPPYRPPEPEPEPERSNELKFLTAAEDFASPAHPHARPASAPQPRRHTPPPRPAPQHEPPSPPQPEPAELEPMPEAELEPDAQAVDDVGTPVWPDEFEGPSEPESEQLQEVEEPAPAAPRRRRRLKLSRRMKRTLVLLIVGAAAAGAYWWYRPELPLPQWSTIAAKWSAFTGSVSGAVSAAVSGLSAKVSALKVKAKPRRPEPKPGPATPSPAAGSSRPAPSPFATLDVIGDSLTQSVRSFGERAALFSRGQLPCGGLASSLGTVEKRWITYNTARKSAGVLDPAHAVRDQGLYARVDSVERRFEQSGCPRQ
jgi:JAB1/Mov34/MPN/PAD-1 ubiquitin protease